MQQYPWKERIELLGKVSIFPCLLFRPTQWPFLAVGNGDAEFFWDLLNRVTWVVIWLAATFLLDVWVVLRNQRQDSADGVAATPPAPVGFWSAAAAAILAKSFVDFAFGHRPMPEGMQDWLAWERRLDVVCLVSMIPLYMLAQRIGPPRNWRIVQSLVLQPVVQPPRPR